jgi:type IV pilus assembly protein PilX
MTFKVKAISCSPKKQQGVILAIGLIMLLLMTLIGTTGMQMTTLQEKMTGNFKDRNLAFQSSEAALRDAEQYLRNASAMPAFNSSNGLYQPGASGVDVWTTIDWSDASDSVQYSSTIPDVSSQPRYIIEELPAVLDSKGSLETGVVLPSRFYRATSRAVGGTDTAVVILQSVYKR